MNNRRSKPVSSCWRSDLEMRTPFLGCAGTMRGGQRRTKAPCANLCLCTMRNLSSLVKQGFASWPKLKAYAEPSSRSRYTRLFVADVAWITDRVHPVHRQPGSAGAVPARRFVQQARSVHVLWRRPQRIHRLSRPGCVTSSPTEYYKGEEETKCQQTHPRFRRTTPNVI